MRYIIILVVYLFLVTTISAQGLTLGKLLTVENQNYPVITENGLLVMTKSQGDTVVSYLEDRVRLSSLVLQTEIERDYSNLMTRQLQHIVTFDTNLISDLTGIVDLRLQTTVVELKSITHKISSIQLFLTEEREDLITKNNRLRKTIWISVPIVGVLAFILAIN